MKIPDLDFNDSLENHIQLVITNLAGIVQESDQSLFHINKGKNIASIHPFFMNLESLINSTGKSIFQCVQLDFNKKTFLTDIEIQKSKSLLAISIHDLTQHYTTFQKLAQVKNELSLENESLGVQTKSFEARDNFKNRFMQHLSHELRTPLMHIASFSNLLMNTPLNQQQKDYISFIDSSSKTLNTMVDELLDLQSIEEGNISLNMRPFSFMAFVQTFKLAYGLKATQKNLSFTVEVADNIPDVLVSDDDKLFQVLTNLLDNAFKYTMAGGVTLKIGLNQKWGKDVNLSFLISDTGTSIPQEKRNEIFEDFVRLDNAQGIEGSGLGLPIVRKLLKALKSDIKLTSLEKGGNAFYFDLGLTCIRKADERLPKHLKKRISQTSSSKIIKNKKHILIVEDDQKTQMVLFKYLLEEHLYEVDAVSSGDEVIAMLLQNNYDLVLVDINLPTIKGHEIASIVRDLPNKKLKSTPIIAVTANAFDSNIEHYLSCGINHVITKPFYKQDLIHTVQNLLK